MNINKKGVSDVITTVLIILLVLAAVAIIGGIILRNLGQAGRQINEQTACSSNIVEADSCTLVGKQLPELNCPESCPDPTVSCNKCTVYILGFEANVVAKRTIIGSGSQITKITAVSDGKDFYGKLVSVDATATAIPTDNGGTTTISLAGGTRVFQSANKPKKVTIQSTYTLSDGSTATCNSVPLVCT